MAYRIDIFSWSKHEYCHGHLNPVCVYKSAYVVRESDVGKNDNS